MDDDNFIDDSGVDPSDRYGSDSEPRFAHDAPQVNTPLMILVSSLDSVCALLNILPMGLGYIH